MDAILFSAKYLRKNNLIGKKLQLGTSIFIIRIPLIAQLVERKTVASTRYWHNRKTDSTDNSVGRAEDYSVRSKFESNP